MGKSINPLCCTQCGSMDVSMVSETLAVCNSCGTKLIIDKADENGIVSCELDDFFEIGRYKIVPEYTKEQFLREVWIKLAKEDVPLDVFEQSAEFLQKEYETVIDMADVDVDFNVSIGYYREEPYIDTEYYYEDEPYIATEQYYDSQLQSYRERQVTKYKRVQKQRPVTRYNTVTDWSLLSQHHLAKSLAVFCNHEEDSIPTGAFIDSYTGADNKSTVLLSDEESSDMIVTDYTRKMAVEKHKSAICRSIESILPGDTYRDLNYNIVSVTNKNTRIYKVPMYHAGFEYNGDACLFFGFPFGELHIFGDSIENKLSLEQEKKQMKEDTASLISGRKDKIDKNIADATSLVTLITICTLAASIAISILIRSYILDTAALFAGIAAFIFNEIVMKSATKKENESFKEYEKSEKARCEHDIENYSQTHRKKLLDSLNSKLSAEGLEPATESELFGEE